MDCADFMTMVVQVDRLDQLVEKHLRDYQLVDAVDNIAEVARSLTIELESNELIDFLINQGTDAQQLPEAEKAKLLRHPPKVGQTHLLGYLHYRARNKAEAEPEEVAVAEEA